MSALYITSPGKSSGKTALGAGLGKLLTAKGKKIGFFKPVIAEARSTTGTGGDSDAQLMKQLFALAEPVDLISPVIRRGSNLNGSIKEAYAKVAQGKDVVIIEGTSELYPTSRDIVTALNARVLILEAYSKELLKTLDSYKDFGQSLLGIVLNKVPETRMEQMQTEASARLSRAGINLLGVLPEDRTLLALTIGELTEGIHGEFLSGIGQSAELVENLMLGAAGLDPGPDYFGRKVNKAVLLKSERPDMQLAALQTPLRCLVLAGSTQPNPMVINDANAKNVPIVIAKDSVSALVTNIEDTLVKTKFNQPNKLPKLTEIMKQRLDLQRLYQGLG